MSSTYTPVSRLFVVEVRRWKDDGVERTSEPFASSAAARHEQKIVVTLDAEQFYTAIRPAREDERPRVARRNVL